MAKIEIKTIVTGGDQAAQDLNKTSQALAQTTQVTKQTGEATEGLTVKKNKLIEAIKKATHEIPGFSYAVGALKNPFVALAAIIAISIRALNDFGEKIKAIEQAVGKGTIVTNFQEIGKILARSKVDAKELADEVARIRGKPATLQEQGAKAQADLERNLQVEAAADEQAKAQALAGVKDPEARAAIEARFDERAKKRAQRKLGGAAAIAAEKEFRGRQDFQALGEQAPQEQAALESARNKHRREMELFAAQEYGPEAIAAIDAKIKEGEEALESGPTTPGAAMFWWQMGTGGYQPYMDSLRAERENMQRQNQMIGAGRERSDAALRAAEGRYARFRADLTGAAENTRTFASERDAAMANAEAMRPYNDPGSQAYNDLMAVQRRYEAQAIRLLENLEKRTANTNAVLKAQSQDAR